MFSWLQDNAPVPQGCAMVRNMGKRFVRPAASVPAAGENVHLHCKVLQLRVGRDGRDLGGCALAGLAVPNQVHLAVGA
jgi:hypothetical protein